MEGLDCELFWHNALNSIGILPYTFQNPARADAAQVSSSIDLTCVVDRMAEAAVPASKTALDESKGPPDVAPNVDAEKGHISTKPEPVSSLSDPNLVRASCNFSTRFTMLIPMERLRGTGLTILQIPKIGVIEENGPSLLSFLPTHAFRLCQPPLPPLL